MERDPTHRPPAPDSPDGRFLKDLEEGVIGVKKAARDLAFYPPNHPSLLQSLEGTCQALLGLLARTSPLSITVTRDSLQYGKTPLGKENPTLRQLAADLRTRRIQRIVFAPSLSPPDIRGFLEMLAMDPNRLMEEGGPTRVLEAKGVTGLQVTELQLHFQQPAQGTGTGGAAGVGGPGTAGSGTPGGTDSALPGAAGSFPPEERGAGLSAPEIESAPVLPEASNPESLLDLLEEAGDLGTYLQTAGRLIECGRTARTGNDLETFVRILSAFVFHTHPQTLKPSWVQAEARTAIASLGDEAGIAYLLGRLCEKQCALDDDLIFLLVSLGDPVVPAMLEWLAEEENLSARRKLMGTLSRLGPVALPHLVTALQDDRWYVVRNLVLVLGSIGLPEGVPPLRPLLRHPDPRVRREVVRALTRIGTTAAADALLAHLGDPDPGVRQSIIIALGTLKVARAIPPLADVARQFSPFTREVIIQKAAITALGSIGDPQAVPVLTNLLRRRTWLNRRLNDEVRAAAATALATVATHAAREALLAEAQRGEGPVPRACQLALERLMGGPVRVI